MAGVKGQQPACPVYAPKTTSCKRTAVASGLVEGKVDGVLCPVVIDPGSETTIVRPDVISHRQLPAKSHRLHGVTGHSAELRGPVSVKLELGGRRESVSA